MKAKTDNTEANSFKLNYFFMYGSLGLALPFFPVFLKNYGCGSSLIAFLQSLQPILLCFAPALVGQWVSKGLLNREKLIVLSAWGSFLTIIPLFLEKSLTVLIVCLILHSPFRVIISPLVDASCLEYLKRTGKEYGRLRLFGSLGFIIASLLGGSLFSIGPVVPFLIAYALLQIGQIVTANSLRRNFQDTQTTAEAKNLSKTLIKVFWPPIILFLLFSFLHQVSQGTYYVFYSIYINEQLNIPMDWIGAFWIIGVVAEIVIMFSYQRIWGKIKEEWVFIISAILNAIRWWFTAHCTSIETMVLLQTLHAFSFGTYQVAAMRIIERQFPERSRSFGVGLFVSLSYGLGGVVGMNGAGWLSELHTLRELFEFSAVIAILAAIPVFLMLLKSFQPTSMANRST